MQHQSYTMLRAEDFVGYNVLWSKLLAFLDSKGGLEFPHVFCHLRFVFLGRWERLGDALSVALDGAVDPLRDRADLGLVLRLLLGHRANLLGLKPCRSTDEVGIVLEVLFLERKGFDFPALLLGLFLFLWARLESG